MSRLFVRVALWGILIAIIVAIFGSRKDGEAVLDTTLSIMKWIIIIGIGGALLIGLLSNRNRN